MTRTRNLWNDWLLVAATLVLLVLCLPLLAVFALVGRGVLLAAALAALVGGPLLYAASPAFRAWFQAQTDEQLTYSGLRLAADVALHPGHSWARIEPDEVRVGADDLVQAVLGPVEAVEVPAAGRRVRRGDRLVRLRHGDRAVDLPAPVSGTVLGANRELAKRPWLVNEEPFAGGWTVRLRTENPRGARRGLLFGHRARAWFRREVDRLIAALVPGGSLSPSLPDGGMLVGQLHRHIDEATWKRLTETFFNPEPEQRAPIPPR